MRPSRGGAPVLAVPGKDAAGQEPPLRMQGVRVLVTPLRKPRPVDLASYGYMRAPRDALNFAALSGRFIQNLRRYVGGDLQYFAAALSRPVTDHLMGSPGWAAAGFIQ
jgi:hypothetical protein